MDNGQRTKSEKIYWKIPGEHIKSTPEEFADEFKPEGVDRREFLKLMGASLMMASLAGCSRRPVEKIVPYLNKPEEITPGVANWYASTCGECPAACGILAKTREGRPIKLEGNPDHPMNQGGLCARGQASLLNLYDPDRLKGPVRQAGKNGGKNWEGVDWAEADREIGAILKAIGEKKGSIRLLTGEIGSPSTARLIQEFLGRFADAKHIVFEPLSAEELARAQELCYGEKVIPRYLLEKAELVVSFGADFLDTWISPVEFTKDFSKNRRLEKGRMSRFVCFESVPTATGSAADLHIPVRPGDEIQIALGLAHAIADNPSSLETVAEETGVDIQILRRLVKDLLAHKGRSLVLGGGFAMKGEGGVALHAAANYLNHLLENDGATLDAKNSPSYQSHSSRSELLSLIQEMKEGKVDLLLIHKTNPVYALPESVGFAKGLQQVPHIVSFADRVDETTLMAHWVLPTPHYLESWGDAEPQRGLFSLQQPAIAPLYDTRAFEETLLGWTTDNGQRTTDQKQGWHGYLKKYWEENIYKKYGIVSSFITFWETSLRNGVFDSRKSLNGHPPRPFNINVLSSLQVHSPQSIVHSPILVLHPTIPHYDGRSANNSWLMELPDPVTKITWNNYVSLSPAKAKDLKIREGDVLKIKTKEFEAELIAHLQPGLHPEALAVPLGFGRTQAGSVANGIGVNAFQFGSFIQEASVEKTGKWESLATTQKHHDMQGRPIIKEATFEEYQKNPKAGNEENLHLPSMWSGHKYEGYRWGMAIDLSACTGCSACMIACQAENNIAVVGEKQVKKGREMHWIRIDRYYSGSEENPEVAHQPMLCQHCENAPCETVCPVLATVHNEEGLNVQVYNRCVATRYCSNNCPYKVRRFNWFEYLWKTQTPLAMVLNPDVTVREKGVMEKCTFCVQRIQEGKDKAKDFGRKVQDGEIKTACQQSCPAEAIVFGDLNDPESKVSKLRKDPRGYHVLDDLNTRPAVTYLTKVRNA